MERGNYELLDLGSYSISIVSIIWNICNTNAEEIKIRSGIREEGPAWHASKSGNADNGRIIFILSIIVTLVAMFVWTASDGISMGNTVDLVLVILLSLAFGAIGFIDDYIKVVKKRNLGLTAAQKFSLQFVAALIFATVVRLEEVPERWLTFRLLRWILT